MYLTLFICLSEGPGCMSGKGKKGEKGKGKGNDNPATRSKRSANSVSFLYKRTGSPFVFVLLFRIG